MPRKAKPKRRYGKYVRRARKISKRAVESED